MDHAENTMEQAPSKGFMDTETSQLDIKLIGDLEYAICKQNDQERLHEIARIVSEYSPVDLAFVAGSVPKEYRLLIFESLPEVQDQVEFIISTDQVTRRIILKQIDDIHIKHLINDMPPDEAVPVLETLPEWRFNAILCILDEEKAKHIMELQQYDFNTAGRFMTNEFFAFSRNTTIGEVIYAIRNNPNVNFSKRIFVLNDEERLEGYVSARNMIINPQTIPLRYVMHPIFHKVRPGASRNEVIDLVERYKISTLPVVDNENVLLGVITYDDVVEVMEELADDTIAQMAGTAEEVKEQEPTIKRFLLRAPWLVVTLCAGLFIATTLSTVSQRAWYAMASFFVPMITGMSGNVGVQCSTVLVRSMATGEFSKMSRKAAVAKELMIGAMAGLIFGTTAFIALHVFYYFGLDIVGSDPFATGMIVSSGIMGACLNASMLGVLSPLFFVRIGVDPAVASGPIVTAFNDVSSTFIYCVIARIVSAFVL